MTAPGIDHTKLGKVLALLASNMDGEALAAARAAVRMLAAAGLRPEALADGMTIWLAGRSDAAAGIQPGPPPAPPSPPKPRKPPPSPSFRDLKPSAQRFVLADLLAGDLGEADRTFLAMVAARLRTAPHQGLTTAELRRINKAWRATP